MQSCKDIFQNASLFIQTDRVPGFGTGENAAAMQGNLIPDTEDAPSA